MGVSESGLIFEIRTKPPLVPVTSARKQQTINPKRCPQTLLKCLGTPLKTGKILSKETILMQGKITKERELES
jgi:hypothetical protein